MKPPKHGINVDLPFFFEGNGLPCRHLPRTRSVARRRAGLTYIFINIRLGYLLPGFVDFTVGFLAGVSRCSNQITYGRLGPR